MATTRRRTPTAVVVAALAVGAVAFVAAALTSYLAIDAAYVTVHVVGVSMSPTLNPGDYALARKTHGGPFSHGDIVVIRDPYDPRKDFIKRVVALPGERLQIASSVVSINGSRLNEPYLNPEPWKVNNTWPANGSTYLMPPGSYFVMGDNRNHSSDSTAYGPVASGMIEAVVFERVWPAPGRVR